MVSKPSMYRTLLAAGVAALAFAPGAAHATPIGGVYEGGGYAVGVGTGTTAIACLSTAAWLPQSATVSISPVGVSTKSQGLGSLSAKAR